MLSQNKNTMFFQLLNQSLVKIVKAYYTNDICVTSRNVIYKSPKHVFFKAVSAQSHFTYKIYEHLTSD